MRFTRYYKNCSILEFSATNRLRAAPTARLYEFRPTPRGASAACNAGRSATKNMTFFATRDLLRYTRAETVAFLPRSAHLIPVGCFSAGARRGTLTARRHSTRDTTVLQRTVAPTTL